MSENLLQRFAQFIQLTNRNDTAVLAYLCRYFICASDCCPVQCSGVQRNLICGAKKFKQKMQRSQR